MIFAFAWRSAEQETAIAIGSEAPCLGRRMTLTSWQKYLPPNCAPIPSFWVRAKTSFSSSISLKALPVLASPVVGSESRYFVEASFAVFAVNSADVPPITIAR